MYKKYMGATLVIMSLIALASMVVFTISWYTGFQKFTGSEFGLSNDWWLQVIKKDQEGKINASDISAIVTAFLYMPLQTCIGGFVLILAILNYKELEGQIRESKRNQKITELLGIISIVDEKLSDDIKKLEADIISANNSKDDDPTRVLRFRLYMKENLPFPMFDEFERTYFPDGYDPFSKVEPIKLYIDYFTKMTDFDVHLGSSFGGTAASSLMMLLLTIPKNEKVSKSESYDLLFNYLYSKLNHRDVDSRVTLFNLSYSHFALTGRFEDQIVEFFSFCIKKLSNSIQGTDDGDFFEKLYFTMISSDNFLFSTSMKNNFKVKFGKELDLDVCISDKYTRRCFIHNFSRAILSDINEKDVFESIESGLYVNDFIYIDKRDKTPT